MVDDYRAAPRLLVEVLSDVFAECTSSDATAIHNDKVKIVSAMVQGGRSYFLERVADFVLDVAQSEIMKEKNG